VDPDLGCDVIAGAARAFVIAIWASGCRLRIECELTGCVPCTRALGEFGWEGWECDV
jgi:hypothetical protein